MNQQDAEVVVGADAAEAVRLAAERVVASLRDARHGAVALAGGRTPAALYRLLTQPPCREAVRWEAIDWFWGDERCVPPDHADSNYRMAMEHLLGPLGVPSERIHRMPADAADLDAAAREHEAEIRRVVPAGAGSVPRFDVVLLGIGADGHTASLFPGSTGLNEMERLVVAHHAPGPDAWRMTMTFPLLNAARQVIFLATGEDKAPALHGILRNNDTALPATLVRPSEGASLWVLDGAAARLVHPAQQS